MFRGFNVLETYTAWTEVMSLQTDFSFTSVRCSKGVTSLTPLFYVYLRCENVLEKA